MSNATQDRDPKRIEGNPTKELFVDILTRDLSIEDAINDLIDNSIDGAKRLRPDGNYEGLYVEIQINENSFEIKDNCGGISIEIAREYAFRFGRSDKMPPTEHSIGQFGVGMKRAIFKLGTVFYVESTHKESEFAIVVDIDDWLKKKDENGNDDWSFEFNDDFKEGLNNSEEATGTKINVEPIRENLKKYLSTKKFLDGLKSGIENKHMQNLYQGMRIEVNGELLKSKRPEFIKSESIGVAKREEHYDKVEVTMYVGIGDDIPEDGGWYIFCNDRLLLGPEQTALSGWTGKGGGGVANYHQQYCRFRGLVYFKAKNAGDLPWNTSKNNLDLNSPVFWNTKSKMIEMMKPIVKFLNIMKKERETAPDGSIQERPLEEIVLAGESITVSELKDEQLESVFTIPKIETEEPTVKMVNISYKKPKDLVEKAKKALKVRSSKQVGEKTFDYFITMEEVENE